MTLVLVTGSRTWSDPVPIIRVLNDEWSATVEAGDTLWLMHGDCRDGADAFARRWCESCRFPRVRELARPANWNKHGKTAGFIRNGEMAEEVARTARLTGQTARCHAFIRNESNGATDCARKAADQGIEVVEHGWLETAPWR
jgi:hypothetical protein